MITFAADNKIMPDRNYKLPPIVWLKVTDYMYGWIQHELGSALRIKDQRVICVQHLPGAREILRMETAEDLEGQTSVSISMSATWKNCIETGLSIDECTTEHVYGITKDAMKLYVPIECPKNCINDHGLLRPWTGEVNFGKNQANSMLVLLRKAFWQAVADFDKRYAKRMNGEKYAIVKMLEDFCLEHKTSDMYVEIMCREWRRQKKRVDA